MRGRTGCWDDYYNGLNKGVYNRSMDVNYWMFPGVSQCMSNGQGITCSTYGPKDIPRTTQESFLQGRGQVLNDKCPDGDVVYLPAAVFALGAKNQQDSKCQVTELTPYFERQPKSCFNISETDTTAYTMGIPSAWQGTNVTVTDFNGSTYLQDREMGRMQFTPMSLGSNAVSRGSYGTY